MDEIESIRKKLLAMRRSERIAFAEKHNIPFDTLQKFALSNTQNPRVSTFVRISEALRTEEMARA